MLRRRGHAARAPARDASRTAALAIRGSRENDRPASAAPLTLGTSATGANVTVTPAARSPRAAASASERTVPRATCSGCATNGPAQEAAAPFPPSWSTATIGRPPVTAKVARERTQLVRAGDVAAEQDHAGDSPLAQRLTHVGRNRRALKLSTRTWPTCCSSVSASTAAGVRAPPRRSRPTSEREDARIADDHRGGLPQWPPGRGRLRRRDRRSGACAG